MTKNDEFESLRQTLLRFINKYNELIKKPMDYGTGDLLYPSEMHTLEVIGKNPGINVTGIARKLGVTKGAISQTIKKLVKKQMVRRFKDGHNEKAVLLNLDRQGEFALERHERFHAKYDAEIMDEFNKMTAEQRKFMGKLFQKLEDSVDKYLKDLS